MSSNSPITGRPNTQPITKEKDKHRKVLQKLQAYKKAYDKQSFQSQLPTEEIRVGLESSAPFSLYSSSNSHGMHTPFGSEYSPHPKPSSVSSHGTAFTQDTRHSTSVWSASNGMEAQEKQKKKLGPVLQARKDLVRTLGSCQLCSPRKIKVNASTKRRHLTVC